MHTVCSFFNFYLSFLILGIRKLLTAVDDLIVIRFAPCAFMVLAFFTDFLIIWLDLELIRDIWFIAKHTINARRDQARLNAIGFNCDFNSHASCEAWHSTAAVSSYRQTISTHTPHARRDRRRNKDHRHNRISTHTPHARRDIEDKMDEVLQHHFNSHASCEAWLQKADFVGDFFAISTHTPHARRDFKWNITRNITRKFQLTRLMRDVTYKDSTKSAASTNFNSHASCETWRKN